MPQLNINKSTYNIYKYTAFLSIAVIFLLGVVFLQPFSPDNSYAETHTDSASGAYNGTTYSLSTTVSDLDLELHALPSGSTAYGAQTVSVTTNAPGGYQLYVNTTGVLASDVDSSTIPSITGSNVALDTNTWGYTSTTPSGDMDTAGSQTIWNSVPTTLTQVDSSTTTTTNKEKTLYYGVKADNTLTDGNYNGTITYTTIANDAASDTLLSVSPTSGTAGQATNITITTSLMTTSTGISASDISAAVGSYTCSSISITSTAPLKFTCNISTSLTAGTYMVTATISKYNKTYTKSSAYTANTPSMDTVTYMQDVTSTMCTNATTWTSSNNKEYTLTDSRDNSTYKIRKLADGNCWMVQNLRLINKKITSADSDVSSDFTIPASSLSTGTTNGTWGTTDNANGINHTAAYYNNNTTYGAYYNWYTATAGSGTYSTSSGTSVNSSICPKGWKLPYGTQVNKSWYYLYNTGYSSNVSNFQSATLTGSGYWAGRVLDGSLSRAGSYGHWWSRTAYGAGNGYSLYSVSGSVRPQNYYSKRYGLAVRCVLSST